MAPISLARKARPGRAGARPIKSMLRRAIRPMMARSAVAEEVTRPARPARDRRPEAERREWEARATTAGLPLSIVRERAAQAVQGKVARGKVERARVERAQVERARVERAQVERARVERARVERARVERARVERARVERLRSPASSQLTPARVPMDLCSSMHPGMAKTRR